MTNKKYKDISYLLFPFFTLILLISTLFLTLNQSRQKQNIQSKAQVETTAPSGQVISLDFRISGIGSKSGNLNPLHKTRDIVLYFYEPDKNSADPTVKSLATFKSSVTYNSDTNSPTYGSFVNSSIDLADKVPDGDYQIAIKTNQSIIHLVKASTTDVGGIVFQIKKSFAKKISISDQTVILGDIYPAPDGDNIISAEDFNALISCFGTKAEAPACKYKTEADLNDDGVINGIDYNILSTSSKVLSEQGIFAPTPTGSVPTQKPTPNSKPTPVNNSAKNKPKSNTGFIVFMIFVVILVAAFAIAIIFFKNRQNLSELEQEKTVAGEFYIKSDSYDDINKREVLTLTNDNGPILGYYKGEKVPEGFATVKGILRKDKDKEYIEISQITPEKPTS